VIIALDPRGLLSALLWRYEIEPESAINKRKQRMFV
jgi:hypothetical protein